MSATARRRTRAGADPDQAGKGGARGVPGRPRAIERSACGRRSSALAGAAGGSEERRAGLAQRGSVRARETERARVAAGSRRALGMVLAAQALRGGVGRLEVRVDERRRERERRGEREARAQESARSTAAARHGVTD